MGRLSFVASFGQFLKEFPLFIECHFGVAVGIEPWPFGLAQRHYAVKRPAKVID
jgi:hypothetical protein